MVLLLFSVMARVKDSRGVYDSTEGYKNPTEAVEMKRTEPPDTPDIELGNETDRIEPVDAPEIEPENEATVTVPENEEEVVCTFSNQCDRKEKDEKDNTIAEVML